MLTLPDGAVLTVQRTPVDAPSARRAQAAYAGELRRRFGFAPGAADQPEPNAIFVIALDGDEPVAYGGIRPASPTAGLETAEIKRMWVHPAWRRRGVGSRMLEHLEALASEEGYGRVVLDTHSDLAEAINLYERAGYQRVERYNDNPDAEIFFAKDLGTQGRMRHRAR